MLAAAALSFLAGGVSDFSSVAEKVADSVVSLRVRRAGGFLAGRTYVGTGSGAIIDDDGYIVTAEHVARGASSVVVTFRSGVERRAEVTGTDPRTDLALLRVSPEGAPPPIELGDSGGVKVGQWALAVGAPFGLEDSFTIGVVSSVRCGARTPSGPWPGAHHGPLIQTDAALNRGNSGGPLVDSAGRMIGVNVIVYTASGEHAQGVGFAVPVNELKKRLAALKNGKPVVYPYLGVAVAGFGGPLARAFGLAPGGALIDDIKPDSPAEAAGLKPGEVIRAVSGERVGTPGDFVRVLWEKKPGEEVELELASAGGRPRKIQIKLGEKSFGGRPAAGPLRRGASKLPFWRGLRLAKSESGARVAGVFPESAAAVSGLRTGLILDEVVASGRKAEIGGPGDFEQFVEAVRGPVAVRAKGLGYFVIEED